MAFQDADFSDEFCDFLRAAVPAVEAAELLLLLRRDPGRAWSLADASSALAPHVSLPVDVIGRYAEEFEACGLAAIDAERRLQYRPCSDALATHVATLEKMYRERPVTLIRVIYGLRAASGLC